MKVEPSASGLELTLVGSNVEKGSPNVDGATTEQFYGRVNTI